MLQKLTKLLLLLMIMLLTNHCRFIFIDQPENVAPGESFQVDLTIAVDIVPEPNVHHGVLCLLLPNDWTVDAATFSSVHADGQLIADAAWADSAEACYPAAQYGTDMQWFAFLSDTGFAYNETFEINVNLQLTAGQTEGCFKLGYLTTKATPGLLCSGSPAWAPLAYPNPITVGSGGAGCDTAMVQRAIPWDDLLHRQSGWTGADGIYSIPLSGQETPGNVNEQTLFVFSDTFIGDVDSSGQRLPGWRLVNNTFAYLDGSEPLDENIEFFWGENNGLADAVFVPDTPQSQSGDWYWLMDGVAQADSIALFGLRMMTGNGGIFNFKIAGVNLITFNLQPDHNITNPRQVDTPLFYRDETDGWEIALGQALMPMTAVSGNPGTDGYIYVYGPRSWGAFKELVAARVLPEHIAKFDQYQYWDGNVWGTDIAQCAPITSGISQEFSVTPIGDKFYLVFQVNSSVAIRIGDSPIGPFGPINIIYPAPEPQFNSDVYIYNAKAHPHLSSPGELLISYNVNTFDFAQHISDAGIYRPRFISLLLDSSSPIVADRGKQMPTSIVLSQNYPNPFNPVTTIPFQLHQSLPVSLKVFDVRGAEVRELLKEKMPAGNYRVVWDGHDASGKAMGSGVYFYHLIAGESSLSGKMVLVK